MTQLREEKQGILVITVLIIILITVQMTHITDDPIIKLPNL